MRTPDDEHGDLQHLLDEAGRWCQPRHPEWATLQTRLAEAGAGPNAPAPGRRSSQRSSRRRRRLVLAGAACASVALAAVGAYLIRPASLPDPPVLVAQAPPPPEPLHFQVALADDCRIEPVGDAFYEVVAPRRIRLEHGELYVSVGAEAVPHDPFIVETPAGEARSTASSFVVETRSVDSPAESPVPRDDPPVPHFGMRALTQVLVLAGVVQLVGSELNLEGRSGEVLAAETAPPVKPVQRLSVPGFWMLGSPQTADELALTDDQKEKLQAISAAYQESIRSVRVNFQEIPVEERQDAIQAIQQRTREAAQDAHRDARNVLTAEQLDRIKTIQLRNSGWAFLQSERYYEQLGITAAQKEKLATVMAEMQQNYAAIQEELRRTREESFERALGILDPEQIEQLKELGIGQQLWWQPQPTSVQAAPKRQPE